MTYVLNSRRSLTNRINQINTKVEWLESLGERGEMTGDIREKISLFKEEVDVIQNTIDGEDQRVREDKCEYMVRIVACVITLSTLVFVIVFLTMD